MCLIVISEKTMKSKCEICLHDLSIGWAGTEGVHFISSGYIVIQRMNQCAMENKRNINLGYPNSGPGDCEYYCRVPGSDDDLEHGE